MHKNNKTLMILSTAPDERLEMILSECGKLGYRSFFCGEIYHEETAKAADAYCIADWNDSSRLVEAAKREKIDGIVGLCDKAMIPASRISAELNLPGNPPESIERLLSKNNFRCLQEDAGIVCPRHFITDRADDLEEKCQGLNFPVIVKPLLCSSSFGMTVLDDNKELRQAFKKASDQSRNGEVVIEEYFRNYSLRIIEIDIFVSGGEILWDGIRYCYRTKHAPLRPVYDVYPADLSQSQLNEIKSAVSSVLKIAGIRIGECNVEGFFAGDGRFFIVEINPRQAGHYNPQDIQLYCGVNLTKLLITTACGDLSYFNELRHFKRTKHNILSYSIFSFKEGILDHIHIDDALKTKLKAYRYLHGQKPGDHVLDIMHAPRPIVKAVFEFDSASELEDTRLRIEELVYPVIKEDL